MHSDARRQELDATYAQCLSLLLYVGEDLLVYACLCTRKLAINPEDPCTSFLCTCVCVCVCVCACVCVCVFVCVCASTIWSVAAIVCTACKRMPRGTSWNCLCHKMAPWNHHSRAISFGTITSEPKVADPWVAWLPRQRQTQGYPLRSCVFLGLKHSCPSSDPEASDVSTHATLKMFHTTQTMGWPPPHTRTRTHISTQRKAAAGRALRLQARMCPLLEAEHRARAASSPHLRAHEVVVGPGAGRVPARRHALHQVLQERVAHNGQRHARHRLHAPTRMQRAEEHSKGEAAQREVQSQSGSSKVRAAAQGG